MVDGEPFHQAANAPRLLEAVDQLLDGEAWKPRPNLGLLVIRFPSPGDPGDTGWHIDASFPGPTTDTLYDWYVNYRSKGRGLLLLCLLSDIAVEDAPTRILEGFIDAIPPLLRPFGDDGVMGLSAPLPDPEGPIALATGPAATSICATPSSCTPPAGPTSAHSPDRSHNRPSPSKAPYDSRTVTSHSRPSR